MIGSAHEAQLFAHYATACVLLLPPDSTEPTDQARAGAAVAPPPPRAPEPPSRPARVAHPYDAAEPWQLSAAEGDAVNILETHEDGWADVVTSDGARGMLPVSYLEE